MKKLEAISKLADLRNSRCLWGFGIREPSSTAVKRKIDDERFGDGILSL